MTSPHRRALHTLLLAFLILPSGKSAAQRIAGVALPAAAHAVLTEIMTEAGVDSVVVTRTRSSPEHQVRVMYNFIQRYSVAAAKRMYGAEGDAVVDAYVAAPDNARDRQAAMLAELNRQLPAAREHKRLMHVNDEYTVFDVSLRRFWPADRVDAFVAAARKHIVTHRVLGKDEGEKEAIHIELNLED